MEGSSKFINGVIYIGDNGEECSKIGKWYKESRTCVLTKNVGKYLWIEGSNLTIDGNGHHIQLEAENYIYDLASKRSSTNPTLDGTVVVVLGSNVTIKNLKLEGSTFSYLEVGSNFPNIVSVGIWPINVGGVRIVDSEIFGFSKGLFCAGGEISNNKIHSNYEGFGQINNCKISENNIFNNEIGISVYSHNIIKNNILKNNNIGIYLISAGGKNIITNNLIQNSEFPFNTQTSRLGIMENNTFTNNVNGPQYTYENKNYPSITQNNYWDVFDSKSEGCVISSSSNFCQTAFVSEDFIDEKPWHIKNGWLYDITVPANIDVKTGNSDGETISFDVTGSGPGGKMPVTCNYASGSTFPIGATEVFCSLKNGFVSSFLVTLVEEELTSDNGGGCLIATATYSSEMANEVQQLRELRDNQLLNTASGTAFMGAFNDIYYSFSPIIADYERENPLFKEAVKIAITPMISSLSLMENTNSESEVLGLGLSVIMLNIGMYLGVPAVVIIGIRKRI